MCWKFYGRLCPLSHSARATKIQVFIRSDTSVQSFPFKDNGSLFGTVSINFNSCRSLRNYMKPSKCDHCAASVSASASQFSRAAESTVVAFHDIKVNCVSFSKRPFHGRCITLIWISTWMDICFLNCKEILILCLCTFSSIQVGVTWQWAS